jgi:hypothetical protein
MAGKLEVEGKEILIKSSNGTMAVIPKDKVSMVKGYIDSGKHEMVDKFVGTLKEFKHDNQKAGDGLYANIHAKRQRIAAGSGERMRKPGEAGAPTAGQFKQAAKTAKAGDGKVIPPPVRKDLIRPDGTMKDVGFLGPLKSPSGKDVTEYSVGFPIMGKEMDIPTLVPGLSREEIAYVLQRADKYLPIGKDAMGNAIVQKASQHAMQRVKKGMSPFYSSVIDKAVPEMPADATAVRPVKVPVIIPPKAEYGMMIAPMPKMNQKAKDGMCISSMSTMKQKAADGVKIVPPAKRKPIVVTNPNDSRLKAYQDSSFIKKNFNTYPRPKGYDQALKRVGQHPASDYFPAPKQPVIYKEPIQKKPSPPKSGGSPKPVEPAKPVEKEITPPDTTPAKPVVPEKVVTTDTTATEKKTTPVEKPTPKKMPKAIMPTRQGGWSKQPLLMRLFPKLYKK